MFYLFIFRAQGREGERGAKPPCVVASPEPPTRPATQAHALTGDPWVCRSALNPLTHTCQGKISSLCVKGNSGCRVENGLLGGKYEERREITGF